MVIAYNMNTLIILLPLINSQNLIIGYIVSNISFLILTVFIQYILYEI